MLKGLVLVTVAFMLDMAQFFIMLAFTGVVTVASGFLGLIPVAGTITAGAISAGGFVAGLAIDVALSFGFGSFLLMLLKLNDTLSIKALLYGTPVELFLPFLPAWTAIVIGSLYNKYQEDKALEQTNEVPA